MPPPTVARERKRQRTSPRTEDEDSRHTDDDTVTRGSEDTHPTRPGQAERKRELERNRRNLVNVRFAELEAELHRTAARPDASGRLIIPADPDPPAPTKGKRIDKEAVLKDAAHRLAMQRKDLAVMSDRMGGMSKEIDNLRAEKVELRSDKAYLRSELDTVRDEVRRLRTDNINLWEALKKASSIKDAFAPDVAKIPAELFLRRANIATEQMTNSPAMGNTMVQQAVSMPLQQQIPIPSRTSGPMSQQSQQQQPQRVPRPPQQQQSLRSGVSDSQQSSPNLQGRNTHVQQQQQQQNNMNTDAFLVLQSPEELTEFFQMPSVMANFPGVTPSTRPEDTLVGTMRGSPNIGGLPSPSPAQTMALAQQSARTTTNIADRNSAMDKEANEEGDPFSDVAHCV